MNKNPEKFAIEYLKRNGSKLEEDYNNFARQVVKIAIEALEKQIPKGIIETPAFQSYYSAGDESETLCPSCENELEIENQIKYCCECGQKLDWSAFEYARTPVEEREEEKKYNLDSFGIVEVENDH